MSTTDHSLALRALACLDLTNLNDHCSAADVEALCARALTAHGPCAAVCIWPRFVPLAASRLASGPVRIATVVNFPHGNETIAPVLAETSKALVAGADEIDMVMAYRLLDSRPEFVGKQVEAVRGAAHGALLKVILETGELGGEKKIADAARIAIDAGADFIKTSTGKVAVNATPGAARLMLAVISDTGGATGFKAAGGIRTLSDAAVYFALADEVLGPNWATPESFRIGASGLLDAILAALDGAPAEDDI